PDVECDVQVHGAVVRAERLHVGHALDAVYLLFDGVCDRFLDDFGACAGVRGGYVDGRGRDFRELRYRQYRDGDAANERYKNREDSCENRTLNEKINQ